MNALRAMYRRLDALQKRRGFKIAASVAALLLVGLTFGQLLAETYRLNSQHQTIVAALSGQSLDAGDRHAVSIAETGTVTLDGRTFGGQRIQSIARHYFGPQGIITPAQANALAFRLLESERPAWAPQWLLAQPHMTWLLGLSALAWLLLVIWMELTLALLLTVIGTAIPVLVGYWIGSVQVVLAFGGMGLLTFTYVLLVRAVMLALSRPHQALAVAHTVLKEATRTRMGVVFIVILLVILPLLPFVLNPEDPLRYRIQTFISWSLGVTFSVAAVLTLFMSCATVAFEIRDRQIWQIVSKPVSKWNYLVGKWLGVASLNAVILLVAGVSIFTFIQYLRQQPVSAGEEGVLDALAVTDEVLTARVPRRPDYPSLTAEQLRDQIERRIADNPELSQLEEVPAEVRASLRRQIEEEFSLLQRSVAPVGTVQNWRTYTFTGLGPAKRFNSTVTLRYRFHILRDDEHQTFPALFAFNEDPNTAVERIYVPTVRHTMPIPPQLIRDDGTLLLTIVNLYEPPPNEAGVGALNWDPEDFEILYRVASFEGNFLRAMLVVWIKLAFLAALGVGCSTFLSFAVACLLSFTVFIAGLMGPFLAESLGMYHPTPMESMDWSNIGMVIQWAFQWVIRLIALLLVFLLSGFGDIKPTESLVEGRFISWWSVGLTILKLGVLWSGIVIGIGFLVLRRRQLAIYSGQG